MSRITLKILVVDDQSQMTDFLFHYLSSINGHHVLIAGNGIEAMKILKEEAGFDLIISDYNMPHMNGVELFNAMNSSSMRYPFILSTSEVLEEADGLDLFAFLSKPYDVSTLDRHIQKLLKSKSS